MATKKPVNLAMMSKGKRVGEFVDVDGQIQPEAANKSSLKIVKPEKGGE